MSLPRLAVVCDFHEENWPSMNLVADMLLGHLNAEHTGLVTATRVCPSMRRRFTRNGQSAKGEEQSGRRFNADRFLNRFWDYPQAVRRVREEFDVFHVMDHSYGQLLLELPAERTIVTCHDLDTFQCLLNPEQEPRSIFFRRMMERTLSGFRKAAFVSCVSVATRDELLAHDLVSPERMVVVPNGVHPSCSPEPNTLADARASALLGPPLDEQIDLLHVGSTIPRKRIDVLLRVFSNVRKAFPKARLIRVGGAFSNEQTKLAEELELQKSLFVLPYIDRDVLAAVYRRAALVFLPSEREGFGLPVVEAMACGTPVVASDLKVLREVGGAAATYCPVGDVNAWSERAIELLRARNEQPGQWEQLRSSGLAQAAKFSWAEYTRKMVQIYMSVVNGQKSVVSGGPVP